MTVAGLGIAQRLGWVTLPGTMGSLSHPLVIVSAIVLYLIEFFADKIPYVDSAWDSIHTIICPGAGAIMGYMAAADMGPAAQIPVALLAGAVSADSRLTKATVRVAINTSSEPVRNSVASVTEDASVAGVLFLIFNHPIIAVLVVILFIVFSIWFLTKMFRFLKKVFTGGVKKSIEAQESN